MATADPLQGFAPALHIPTPQPVRLPNRNTVRLIAATCTLSIALLVFIVANNQANAPTSSNQVPALNTALITSSN